METGDIVISKAGHDEGETFIVTAIVNKDFVLIADGKKRKVESPKLKRVKHLKLEGHADLKTVSNVAIARQIKKLKASK